MSQSTVHSPRNRNHLWLQGLILAAVLGLASTAAWWVWQRYQMIETQLSAIEPRHARLLGLEESGKTLADSLESTRASLARKIYPASQDAAQTGNAAQQSIRTLFADSKLDVISIQVLPPKELKFFDRIGVVVRVEGDLVGMQNAMSLLDAQSPAVWVDNVNIQTVGLVKPKSAQRLAAQFNLFVLRSRS